MEHSPENLILVALDKALAFSEKGQQAKSEELFRFIHTVVEEFPHILWNNSQVWKIAKAFLIMYHYDLFDDELHNISLIHKSYIYAQRTIDLLKKNGETQNSEPYFYALQTQILLLNSCTDCFTDTITELYYKQGNMSESEINVAVRLARRVIPLITYNLLVEIDDNFLNFNGDTYLEELCNNLELENPDLTELQTIESQRVHKTLIHIFSKKFIS